MRKADNVPPYCAGVKKSGSRNFVEPSGPARPCYGRALIARLHSSVRVATGPSLLSLRANKLN